MGPHHPLAVGAGGAAQVLHAVRGLHAARARAVALVTVGAALRVARAVTEVTVVVFSGNL